jgi:hypothetical protein
MNHTFLSNVIIVISSKVALNCPDHVLNLVNRDNEALKLAYTCAPRKGPKSLVKFLRRHCVVYKWAMCISRAFMYVYLAAGPTKGPRIPCIPRATGSQRGRTSTTNERSGPISPSNTDHWACAPYQGYWDACPTVPHLVQFSSA